MKIFSTHRRKLEPKRRFGGLNFRNKIKQAANYKRTFNPVYQDAWQKFLAKIGLASKFWRWTAGIILVVLLYYLWISPRFVVTQVEASGNVQVSAQQIFDVIASAGRSRTFFIKQNNFFLLSEGRVNKILANALPTIKYAKSDRTWPNKIKLEITERVPGFVIKSNNKYFLIDEEGIVVSQVENAGDKLLVEDQVTEDFASKELLPNAKLAPFVLSMTKQWGSKVSTPIVLVKFPGKESSEVQFVTQEGWSVLFDTSRSVVAQLNNLAVLLNKQISQNRSKLAYIDLRLSKWAYYCFKGTACSQVAQPEETNATK